MISHEYIQQRANARALKSIVTVISISTDHEISMRGKCVRKMVLSLRAEGVRSGHAPDVGAISMVVDEKPAKRRQDEASFGDGKHSSAPTLVKRRLIRAYNCSPVETRQMHRQDALSREATMSGPRAVMDITFASC